MPRHWSDIKHMIQHFMRAPHQIGSIVPSSRFLAEKMMNCVDLANAQCVVELGAGTGAITLEMLRRTGSHCRILIIDLNPEAVRILSERFKERANIEVILADARELDKLLTERQIPSVEAIISSLPFTSLGEKTTEEILLSTSKVISKGGHFVAFQYSSLLKKTFEKHFNIRSSRFEFRNLPPAIVYDCVSKNSETRGHQTLKSA